MRRNLGRGAFLAGVTLVLTTLVAIPATAASCTFSSGVLSISSPLTESVTLQVLGDGSNRILVNGVDTLAACGPSQVATTSNTTTINIVGDTHNQTVTVFLYDTVGATISWGTINWTIALGGQLFSDLLMIDNSGGDLPIHVVLGATGIDLNADGNLDVVTSGVVSFTVNGGPGHDIISAAGDATTGSTFGTAVTVNANDGNDAITGGDGSDILDGGADADTIEGGLGNDSLDGGTGAAFFTDEDLVDFSGASNPETINLTNGTAVGQGLDVVFNFEKVIGSSQNDTLIGDGEANRFLGGRGADVLSGLAGDDFLNGGQGKDSVNGGDNTDTCVHGGDSFASCELFAGGGPGSL